MQIPGAVIFINNDLNDIAQETIVSQLRIHEVMTGQEFDARIVADPNYPTFIHFQKIRILVIRSDLKDLTNRNLADLVIFFSHGEASILKNNLGPPGLTLPIARINIYDLLRYNNSPDVVILPNSGPPESEVDEEALEQVSGAKGIIADELRDTSGILIEDPDEDDNQDFIHRKN